MGVGGGMWSAEKSCVPEDRVEIEWEEREGSSSAVECSRNMEE